VVPFGPRRERRCFNSTAAALEEPELFERASFGRHLQVIQSLFQDRLRVIHQDSLRVSAHIAFTELAEFVGAGPFPSSRSFHRHNSMSGQRSGMCQNASLVKVLQDGLAREYEIEEEALLASVQQVPESLRLRRTRCDRIDELQGSATAPVLMTVCADQGHGRHPGECTMPR